MITKSKKLSVAQVTLILNHDSPITAQTSRSDSVAATPGRGNRTSQAKLNHPQASRKSATWNGSDSVQQRIRKAAACSPATIAAHERTGPTSGRLIRRSAPWDMVDMDARSEVLDQPGIDEKAIESARLGAAIAEVECAAAAPQDLLLLEEGWVERQPGRLLDHQRKVGRLQYVERGGKIDRVEVDRVDRVIGGEVARIVRLDAARDRFLVERRIDDPFGEFRLMIAEPHQQEGLSGEVALEARHEFLVVARAHRLPADKLVDLLGIAEILPARRE